MAYCRAHRKLPLGGELNCDLDEGHEPILRAHFDKLSGTMWYVNNDPTAVPYTPTGPIPKIKAGASK